MFHGNTPNKLPTTSANAEALRQLTDDQSFYIERKGALQSNNATTDGAESEKGILDTATQRFDMDSKTLSAHPNTMVAIQGTHPKRRSR